MKATALLRNQHGRLDRLLERLGSERQSRMQLVLELVEELFTHLSIEDHFFLCAVADRVGIQVEPHRDEHARLRNAVLQAVFAEADEGAFALRVRELWAGFRLHTRAIERDLLPVVESQLRTEELERIGDRMQTFWDAAVGVRQDAGEAHGHAAE
jgi:hypothetical protein